MSLAACSSPPYRLGAHGVQAFLGLMGAVVFFICFPYFARFLEKLCGQLCPTLLRAFSDFSLYQLEPSK